MPSDIARRAGASHGLRQRGLMLLELLIALGIAATVILGFIQMQDEQDRRSRAAIAAQQALTIGQAMQSYINDQYATLLTLATPARPALVTVPDLVAAGYLPAGTRAFDVYGNYLCTVVVAVPGSPSSRLQGLMVADSRSAPKLNDLDLGRVATGLGGAGGAVYSTVGAGAAEVRGIGGAWSLPVSGPFSAANHRGQRCDGSPGPVALAAGRYMVALWYGKTFNNEDVLYAKEIPGRADLNTMKTPLGLYVDASGTKNVRFGEVCQQEGHLATDGSAQPLYCKKDSLGTLRWTNTYAVDTTGSVGLGKPCTMEGASALDAAGVPMVCKGGTWGNFYATGPSVKLGAACGAGLAGAFAVDAAGVPLVCKDGSWNSPIPIDDGSAGVRPGASCSPNGSLAISQSGKPYVCTGGVWVALNDAGEIRTAEYTSPGHYSFTVPAGVTELTVTLAGGGESGGLAFAGDSGTKADLFPGGSGGFIIDRPQKVRPGDVLSIQVGAGGAMPGSPGRNQNRGNPGEASFISGIGVDLRCSGGGGHPSQRPGWAGSCNVNPSGGVPGSGAYSNLVQGHVRGGQTPIRYGSGGMSGRCWTQVDSVGSDCAWSDGSLNWPDYGNNVNPAGQYPWGINGAVFLRWRE